MLQKSYRWLVLLICMAGFCCCINAQTRKITIRVLDGKTGRIVTPTGILVKADHQSTVHGNWTHENEDGTEELTIPGDASSILIHATYLNSTEYYINCDSPKQIDAPSEFWYAVAEIRTTGVVAANGCVKPKELEKMKVTAKPGEFVIFVRKRNWREQD